MSDTHDAPKALAHPISALPTQANPSPTSSTPTSAQLHPVDLPHMLPQLILPPEPRAPAARPPRTPRHRAHEHLDRGRVVHLVVVPVQIGFALEGDWCGVGRGVFLVEAEVGAGFLG